MLVATAEERVRFGRSGIYDVTVRREGEVVAEFRGRSRSIPNRRTGGEQQAEQGEQH